MFAHYCIIILVKLVLIIIFAYKTHFNCFYMEDLRWLTDKQIVSKIGDNIRRYRLELNMTRKELSDRTDISVTTIEKVEKGENFNINTLIRCLRMLDKIDVLNDLTSEREPTPYQLQEIVEGYHPRLRASRKKL